MAVLHRDVVLCQSHGGCDSERSESQRIGLVWSSSADRVTGGLRHHVPTS